MLERLALLASFSGQGGVERMLVNLMEGLDERGVQVDLLLLRHESLHLKDLPQSVQPIQLGARHTWQALPALVSYLKRERPTHLLAAKDRAGRLAVVARWLAHGNTRIALRLGTNLSAAMANRRGLARFLRYLPIRLLYPHIDRIIAVSNGVAEDTSDISGVSRQRIAVVRNPVITQRMQTLADAGIPHPWLSAKPFPVLIGAGRFTRQKDFGMLLRAFALANQVRPLRLILLGEGRGRSELQRLASTLGIADRVLLPGFQSNPYQWIRHCDLFVLSSRWEGSPNVLTEALALGIPVVSTDCPSGPNEILQQGRFGRLVAVGDQRAMAGAILKTLKSPLPAEELVRSVEEYRQGTSAAAYLRELESC